MKPIDELVALLEESGVEFEARRDSTSHGRLWFARWGKEPDEIDGIRWKFKATEMPGDALMFYVVADAFEEARAAVEATLGHGACRRMTADDVRDAIERNSDASGGNGRDFHNGAYVAIADELNAEMGRTCRNVAVPDEYSDRPFKCSECGASGPLGEGTYHMGESFKLEDGTTVFSDAWPVWKYCPHCGAKVVES